jgi:hypothetical protein
LSHSYRRLFVLNQTTPQWLCGNTLLKNYYSTFRTSSDPPAVGFATLQGSSVQLLRTSASTRTKASFAGIALASALAWLMMHL